MNGSRLTPELIDRELGGWLRDESVAKAPAGLVEDVFARTSRTPQASRWWPPQPERIGDAVRGRRGRGPGPRPLGTRPRPVWQQLPAVAGLAAVLVIAAVIAIGVGPRGTRPAATPSPTSSPTPSASSSPTAPALPTPAATDIAGVSATRLDLGRDSAPIDVVEAFGSIWVANIHASDVRRYDETTGAEVARIPLGSASWFGATDDGLWVTSQNGTGITRIDPATNTAGVHLGDAPPCGAPVLAQGDLWQAACDGDVFYRIDPAAKTIVDTIPARGHAFLVSAAGQLITVGPGGLARVDPATKRITEIGGRAAEGAEFIASDGTTVWVKNSAGMARLDPSDGSVIASFPYFDAKVVTFSGDHAWLTASNVGVIEIDMATNQVTRTIRLRPSPLVAREAGGALWVTDFDASNLWRIDL